MVPDQEAVQGQQKDGIPLMVQAALNGARGLNMPRSPCDVAGAAVARKRLGLIASWTTLPDLVTANQGEDGIVEICEHLIDRGVGIEAGILDVADAEAFVRSELADRCRRVLLEPLDPEPDDAVSHARAIEGILARARVVLPRVYHGDGIASWAVNEYGLRQGHGIRTGLEDTVLTPAAQLAADNAELVRIAAELADSCLIKK